MRYERTNIIKGAKIRIYFKSQRRRREMTVVDQVRARLYRALNAVTNTGALQNGQIAMLREAIERMDQTELADAREYVAGALHRVGRYAPGATGFGVAMLVLLLDTSAALLRADLERAEATKAGEEG